jgi:hypothetical protein
MGAAPAIIIHRAAAGGVHLHEAIHESARMNTN